MNTSNQKTSAASALVAVSNLYLAAVGFRGRSSGEVYSMVMGHGISLATHSAIVRGLCSAGLMTESGHFLTLTSVGQELFGKVAAEIRSECVAESAAL